MTSVVRWVEVHRLAVAAKSGRFEAAINWGMFQGRGGIDKGTLAMAHIGLTGAGEKPARSANKRTDHRLVKSRRSIRVAASRVAHAGKAVDDQASGKRIRQEKPPEEAINDLRSSSIAFGSRLHLELCASLNGFRVATNG